MASLEARISQLEKQMAVLMAQNGIDPQLTMNSDKKVKKEKGKKEKVKKEKVESDDEKPKKKRISGYILFSNAKRDEVKNLLSEDDEKPKNTDVMKELARLWKELDDHEKAVWNAKAKDDDDK